MAIHDRTRTDATANLRMLSRREALLGGTALFGTLALAG